MRQRNWRRLAAEGGIFLSLVLVSIVLARCGGTNTTTGMGAASVTMSDPPSCTDQFMHVYVTVTGVEAHTSASAGANTAGWQNLTKQLSSTNPVQLDLLNLDKTTQTQQPIECLLKTLGSDQSLPVGSYQQLRLMLASNGSSVTIPNGTTNNCTTMGGLASGTLDCVETVNPNGTPGSWYPLELSSQDQTGLKIPPGQILGGPINVASGKTVDININFNTCSSLVPNPANNAYRLNPTLTASQVSKNTSGISGTVVYGSVSGTSAPYAVTAGKAVADATVNLELPNTGPPDSVTVNTGGTSKTYQVPTDTIFDTAVTDSNGHFYFCPLSTDAGSLDLVADAPEQSTGTTAGATIIQNVLLGTKLSGTNTSGASLDVPIVEQGGTTTAPANTAGEFNVTPSGTGTSTTNGFSVDVDLFPMQFTDSLSNNGYEVIVPALNGSAAMPVTLNCKANSTSCTASTSSLVVPANDPLVGSYSYSSSTGGTITWNSAPNSATPSTGSFVIQADGSVGNTPSATCTNAFSPTVKTTAGASGTSGTPAPTDVTIQLTGCAPTN